MFKQTCVDEKEIIKLGVEFVEIIENLDMLIVLNIVVILEVIMERLEVKFIVENNDFMEDFLLELLLFWLEKVDFELVSSVFLERVFSDNQLSIFSGEQWSRG